MINWCQGIQVQAHYNFMQKLQDFFINGNEKVPCNGVRASIPQKYITLCLVKRNCHHQGGSTRHRLCRLPVANFSVIPSNITVKQIQVI